MTDQRFELAYARVNLDRLAAPELKDISPLRGLKALYEAAYPETRHGGDRRGKSNTSGNTSGNTSARQAVESSEYFQVVTLTSCSLAKKLSEHDGISPSSAARYIKIADGISRAVERRIYSSDRLVELIARRLKELLALAGRDDEDVQFKILDLIEAGKADCVADAEERLKLRDAKLKADVESTAAWRKIISLEIKSRDYVFGRALDEGLMDKLLAARGWRREGVAGVEVPNENDLTRYVSAAELVRRPLPGVPTTKKGVHERAANDRWRFIDAPGRGGMMRLYLIEDLPLPAKAEHERRQQIAKIQRREHAHRNGEAPKTFRERVTRYE